MDQGKSWASENHFYLENTDGTLVSGSGIVEMSRKAHMLWRTLNEETQESMAPQTFGQILGKAWEYFLQMLPVNKAHEFLLLCDDREWKLREWCMQLYPTWYCHRFALGDKDVDKAQEIDMLTFLLL